MEFGVFDILSSTICFIFFVYFLYICYIVISNRNIEFNRFWRTRLVFVSLAVLFLVCSAFSNVTFFSNIFSKEKRVYACGISSFLSYGLVFPVFLFMVFSLAKVATSVKALESETPNHFIIRNVLIFSSPFVLISLLFLFLVFFEPNYRITLPYIESENVCMNPTAFSSVSVLASLFCLYLLYNYNDDSDIAGLNKNHKSSLSRFPIGVTALLCCSIVSEIEPFVTNQILKSLKIVVFTCSIVSMCYFLRIIVTKPIQESLEVPIERGTITKRHSKYIDDTELVENA